LNQNDKELYILGVSDRIGRLFDITGLKDLMLLRRHLIELNELNSHTQQRQAISSRYNHF
jgi:anti-anti-sigma regulatory factor